MRKSDIQKLINSYDGKDPESTFFQKGFRKKMFGLRTKGMNELNSFLNSAEMQQLKPEDEITGKNLEELLKIMKAREERIFETNRSYENNSTRALIEFFKNYMTYCGKMQ